MRWFFLLAGFVILAAAGFHAVIGGIDTLNPIMATQTAMEARAAILALWHGMTLLLVLSAPAFFWAFWAGRQKARPLGIFLGLFYSFFALLVAALSFLWFEDPMVLSLWMLLAPAGLFSLVASL